MALLLLESYLSSMVRTPCFSSCSWLTPTMKPSSTRTCATRCFIFDDGIWTFAFRAVMPLRMRVSISAIGSVMGMSLPARLHDAGDVSAQRELAEAEAAEVELAHVRTAAAAHGAAVANAHLPLHLGVLPVI
jgi:hypothetical protein